MRRSEGEPMSEPRYWVAFHAVGPGARAGVRFLVARGVDEGVDAPRKWDHARHRT